MPESEGKKYRRGVSDALARALSRHPVVLLVGPAGVGKSTVARTAFAAGTGTYVDLGRDEVARRGALSDPAQFLSRLGPSAVIDDVHHAPRLLQELQSWTGRTSAPGQALAVTSTAGLVEIGRTMGGRDLPKVSMSALTQGELVERVGRLIPAAFSSDPAGWPFEALELSDYVERAHAGGLPDLVDLADIRERREGYRLRIEATFASCRTQDVGRLRRVLQLASTRESTRIVFAADAAELRVTPGELAADLELLESLGLVRRSAAWTRFRRNSDSVRVYVGDPGYLGAALDGTPVDTRVTPELVLRTLVANEIYAQNAWARHPVEISYWRSKPSQFDIDLLLEDRDGAVIPLSVSANPTPAAADFAAIDAFRRRHPRAYRRGLLFYPGDRIRALSDNRWAVPLSVLWTVADADLPLDVASLDTELEEAASAMRVLVARPRVTDPEIVARRDDLEAAMARSLTPRLERIALVLASLGLGTDAVAAMAEPPRSDALAPRAWSAGLRELLVGKVVNPRLTVLGGLEIHPGAHGPASSSSAPRWVAFVSVVLDGTGTLRWQAGHALLASSVAGPALPTLVGMVGPVLCPVGEVDESMMEQLCAALAASLPDALAALNPAA